MPAFLAKLMDATLISIWLLAAELALHAPTPALRWGGAVVLGGYSVGIGLAMPWRSSTVAVVWGVTLLVFIHLLFNTVSPETAYPRLALVGLVILCGWMLLFGRYRTPLKNLHEQFLTLEKFKVESDNWSDEWRQRQVARNRTQYEAASDALFEQYQENRHRSSFVPAWMAHLFFGAQFSDAHMMFLKHSDEPRRRYELVTGKVVAS